MQINISGLTSQLSQVRGIGSYQQTLTEALTRYAKQTKLSINREYAKLNLITDFNLFKPLKVDRKAPSVLVIHDLIPLKYRRHFPVGLAGRLILWKNRQVIKALTGIITDSEINKAEISQQMQIDSSRVAVVYPAAKAIFENAPRGQKCTLLNQVPQEYLLYVGDVTWNKNLPRLAKAVKRINRTLVLVGSALTKRNNLDNAWLSSFKQFLQEIEGDKRFLFLGFVSDEDLVCLYQNARVVALPSVEEGFGLPWLESAWLGVPVVVGKTAVSQEIAGDAAIYVNPLSVTAITEGFENALYNNNRALVRKQLQRAKHFSQQQFVVNLEQALYNLCNYA